MGHCESGGGGKILNMKEKVSKGGVKEIVLENLV